VRAAAERAERERLAAGGLSDTGAAAASGSSTGKLLAALTQGGARRAGAEVEEEEGGAGGEAAAALRAAQAAAAAAVNRRSPRELVLLRISAAHELAKSLQVLGLHSAAEQHFSAVLASAPRCATALLRRGLSRRALGTWKAAAADMELARALSPGDDRFCLNYVGLAEVHAVVLCAAGEEELGPVAGLDASALT